MWRSVRLLMLLALLIVSSSAFGRTWTDRQGSQITGKYVRVYQGNVVILRAGRSMTIPLSQLSDEDQLYVQEQIESRKSKRPSELQPTEPEKSSDPTGEDSIPEDTGEDSIPEDNEPIIRLWTDVKGTKIIAKFSRVNGDQIILLKGASLASYPFIGFCKADQDYLREILQSQGETEALAALDQAEEEHKQLTMRITHPTPRPYASSDRSHESDRPKIPEYKPPTPPRYQPRDEPRYQPRFQPRSPTPDVLPQPTLPKSFQRPRSSPQTPKPSSNRQSSPWSPQWRFFPRTNPSKEQNKAVAIIKCIFMLFIAMLVGTLIGGVSLKMSCWLFNRLAGGPNSRSAIPEPEFNDSLSIAFMFCVIAMLEYLLILGMVLIGFTYEVLWVMPILPIACFFLSSGLVSSQLPTTFSRGMLVMIIQIILSICLGLMIICPLSLFISLISAF